MRLLLALILGLSPLLATNNEDYIGGSFGNTNTFLMANITLAPLMYDQIAKKDDYFYTVILGHYYGMENRISASYTYIQHDNKFLDSSSTSSGSNSKKGDLFSCAYDTFVRLGENPLYFYAGPVIASMGGIHYGGQLGALVRFSNILEIDGGYRHFIQLNTTDENIHMWYIGANVRF